MARRDWMTLLAVLAIGCARSGADPQPPPVSVAPVATEASQPETPAPTPTVTRSDVPEAPWQLSYHDHSGNGFQFEQKSASESARYAYSPVTPERSSSGTYSGGVPAEGSLDREQAAQLWQRVSALEADQSLRSESRDMGTGAFHVLTSTGTRQFIIKRGEELAKFDEFLAPFRGR